MAIRDSKNSRAKHETLIRALIKKYESNGLYVEADHIGHLHGRPPEIGGHIPDIAAYEGSNLYVIAEAETCDTISDESTREQWYAFSNSGYRFEVIVPKSCLESVKFQAGNWGIRVDQWWWIDI